MNPKLKQRLNLALGFGLLGLLGWLVYWLFSSAWSAINEVDTNLAVGLVTGASTIVVATITVVIGKYFERRKEVEVHFRESKIEIYDEFLKEFFKLFNGGAANEQSDENELADFLREWQRKMVLYGGAKVLLSYLKWKGHLNKGTPDAQTFFPYGRVLSCNEKRCGTFYSRARKRHVLPPYLEASRPFS